MIDFYIVSESNTFKKIDGMREIDGMRVKQWVA